jgi:uncharacterized protein YeaO (DUF488 family)
VLKIKRAYEAKTSGDGKRIYVDRLWPRGLSKDDAGFDEWLKEVSPSDELRKWFGHEPDKFAEFKRKYAKELSAPDKQPVLRRIGNLADQGDITLIYSARDTEHNNAVVLAEVVRRLMNQVAPK